MNAFKETARYCVERLDGYGYTQMRVKTLKSGLTYDAAKLIEAEETEKLKAEPGYRRNVMCRPIIGVRLENPVQCRDAMELAKAKEKA